MRISKRFHKNVLRSLSREDLLYVRNPRKRRKRSVGKEEVLLMPQDDLSQAQFSRLIVVVHRKAYFSYASRRKSVVERGLMSIDDHSRVCLQTMSIS